MIKIELSYLIVVSYNNFLFKMDPSRKPRPFLAHFGRVAAPSEGRAGVLGGRSRGQGTEPAGQADRTAAHPCACTEKGTPDRRNTCMETRLLFLFVCLFLITENKNILGKDTTSCRRSKQSSELACICLLPAPTLSAPLGEGATATVRAQPALPTFASASDFAVMPGHS